MFMQISNDKHLRLNFEEVIEERGTAQKFIDYVCPSFMLVLLLMDWVNLWSDEIHVCIIEYIMGPWK